MFKNNIKHLKTMKYHLAALSSTGGPPKDPAGVSTPCIQPGVHIGFQTLGRVLLSFCLLILQDWFKFLGLQFDMPISFSFK